MQIDVPDDIPANFFNLRGYMADSGKIQMWKEIDTKIKKFDRHEILLRPSRVLTEKTEDENQRYKHCTTKY